LKRTILVQILLLTVATVSLNTACAPSTDNYNKSICGANVVDRGLQLLVKKLSTSEDYTMELCAAANPVSTYSVYGAITETELTPININLAASMRLRAVVANNTGSSFQVRFHGTDKYFAIYQDKQTSTNLVPDATEQGTMVTPHLLPGKN